MWSSFCLQNAVLLLSWKRKILPKRTSLQCCLKMWNELQRSVYLLFVKRLHNSLLCDVWDIGILRLRSTGIIIDEKLKLNR